MSEYPSSLQATLASIVLHTLSHTEAHRLLIQTSTRPSRAVLPSSSLTLPSGQPENGVITWMHAKFDVYKLYNNMYIAIPGGHLTPASLACVHELTPSLPAVHSLSMVSFPIHCTLSNHILPVPSPKCA